MRIALYLLLTFCAAGPAAAASSRLPEDVSRYLRQRAQCDHWRGEDGNDAERAASISWFACMTCFGVDAQLAALKKRYHGQKIAMDELNVLELQVEAIRPDGKVRHCVDTRDRDLRNQ
jgi:hypothetical protein